MGLYYLPMNLDPVACYRALCSRDSRFDGKFFVAVKSTGIYCRPICPAPTALSKNCQFFSTAAGAESAGFRPCLRCFPESSPSFFANTSVSETVRQALMLIEHENSESRSVEDIAQNVGVSSRHLNRIFQQQLNLSPSQIIKTKRLQMAKKLISETPLTMSQIAMTSGFPSTKQFNAEIKKIFNRAPSDLRNVVKSNETTASVLTINLAYRPPFNWLQIERYFQSRLSEGVDLFSEAVYRRDLQLYEQYGKIRVSHNANSRSLTLEVPGVFWRHLPKIIRKTRQLFDLDSDPQSIDHHLSQDPYLTKTIEMKPGIRILGSWSFFELSLRTIIGQQITVVGAATITRRLVEKNGEPIEDSFRRAMVSHDQPIHCLFPTAEHLVNADLSNIGLTATRIETIKRFSEAYLRNTFRFKAGVDSKMVMASLMSVKGIGPWTANYIAMRALRDPDAFPAADLALLKAYNKFNGDAVSAAELLSVSEKWRPWRGYAAMYLWNSLTNEGTKQ